MYFSTLRFSTLFLFTVLTLSYALPTLDLETSPSLSSRGNPQVKPQPKPKGPAPPKPKPKGPASPKPKPKGPAPPKPKAQSPAKQNTQPKPANGKLDGHVPASYVPKIKVRSEDIPDSSYQHRQGVDGFLGARHGYDADEATTLQVRDPFPGGVSDVGVLKPRNPAEAVAEVIVAIVDIIKGAIQEDNEARGKFTQETVAHGREKFPMFNWVVCHTDHEKNFAGKEGTDWAHRHEEVDIKIGGTIGYEIYWFREGTFHRKGDGGYLNWAWGGVVSDVKDDGKTINFVKPQ